MAYFKLSNTKDMWKAFSRFMFFRVKGWTIEGDFPDDPKYLAVVGPHTSNWDFPIGIYLRSILDQDIKFVAKDALFKWPLGPLLKAMGGYPVRRDRNTRFVDALIQIFQREETFKLCITPEGTRSRVDSLKSGFYYIARGTGVPMVVVVFDWGNKQVRIYEPYYATDDMQADFEYILDKFRGVDGRVPEQGVFF